MLEHPATNQLPQNPPLHPWDTLPTMYDLPSENPEEPGLPDEFHDFQPELLGRAFCCRSHPPQQVFSGSDMNLYYDYRHPQRYKRPDWFLVLGVPRLYRGTEMRSSYVTWQEGVNPFLIVELLSPSTAAEDLGPYAEGAEVEEPSSLTPVQNGPPSLQSTAEPPTNGETRQVEPIPSKWEVYEQILRVPYYVVFSRHTNQLRFFKLEEGTYREQVLDPTNPRIWISELEVGLGLWQGEYRGISRLWLRWYDATGWIPTDTEDERQQKEQALEMASAERQQKEQALEIAATERQQKERAQLQLQQAVRNLLQSGLNVEQVANLMGLSVEQVQQSR